MEDLDEVSNLKLHLLMGIFGTHADDRIGSNAEVRHSDLFFEWRVAIGFGQIEQIVSAGFDCFR